MKFLCDNCKAKYQIADEKVSGRSVRMRCRKCGHLIEIRASVTETSAMVVFSENLLRSDGFEGRRVSRPAPPPPSDDSVTMDAPEPIIMRSSLPRPLGNPPKPRSKPGGGLVVEKTIVGMPSSPPPSADFAAPEPTIAGTPLSLGKSLQGTSAMPHALPPRPATTGGGLASAFQKAVALETRLPPPSEVTKTFGASLDLGTVSASEGWFVAIHGAPIGPLNLKEIRAKINTKLVKEESFVWREGLAEWSPLRTFPELLEMLHTSSASDHKAPPSAALSRSSASSNPLGGSNGPGSTTALLSARSGSTSPRPSSVRGNVIAFHGRQATSEKLDDIPYIATDTAPTAGVTRDEAYPVLASSSSLARDEFDEPATTIFSSASLNSPEFLAAVARNQTEAAPGITSTTPALSAAALTDHRAERPPRPAPGGIPVAGWFAIVAALGTGLAAGAVFFGGAKSVKIMPDNLPLSPVITSSAAPSAALPEASALPATVEVIVDAPTGKSSGKGSPATAPTSKGTLGGEPATPQVPVLTGVPMLSGPVGVSGPSQAGTGSSSSQLTSEQIQPIVNGGRAAIKRACWEPALAAKGGGTSSARLQVDITIGGDGRVQNATPSGGESFPSLGPCIAGRVRQWSFPASAGVTKTAAVFNFVSQLASKCGGPLQ